MHPRRCYAQNIVLLCAKIGFFACFMSFGLNACNMHHQLPVWSILYWLMIDERQRYWWKAKNHKTTETQQKQKKIAKKLQNITTKPKGF